LDKSLIKKLLARKKESHKGDYGHVLVLAGSKGLTGAAYLTSQAAILSGSGLVTLGIPKSLNQIMEAKLTEVMTLPLSETDAASLSVKAYAGINKFLNKIDAAAIGPGLSKNPDTKKLVKKLLTSIDKPFVLDADGIKALDGKPILLKKAKTIPILTPHPGELANLFGIQIDYIQRNRLKVAKEFVKKYRSVLVLKGYKTIVAAYNGVQYINNTGNPGMASGGAGDVLTGIIASFIGQGIEPFTAASMGVYIHGLAGDIAKKEKGETSLIASDILFALPVVFKKIVD